MLKTRLVFVCLICMFMAACGRDGEPPPAGSASISDPHAADPEDLETVRTVLAELLQRSPDQIQPDVTFEDLNADELDLVEAVMELEDRLNISISDEALLATAGTANPDRLLERLTVRALASIVTGMRRGTDDRVVEPGLQ